MKTLEEQIRELLVGIDQADEDGEDAWWETSTGAHFGAEKLAELLELIRKDKQ